MSYEADAYMQKISISPAKNKHRLPAKHSIPWHTPKKLTSEINVAYKYQFIYTIPVGEYL